MQWRDEGIVLLARRHGENHVIAELFCASHGRWRGMVHGGAARARRAWLQPGNRVQTQWRARVADKLGSFTLEPLAQPAAAALSDRAALATLQHVVACLRHCPEQAPHPRLFAGATLVLEHLHDRAVFPALLARFELALLAELGYGLDLSRCALTGEARDLAWVSPKTGRAATRAAGAPWAAKLLPLPAFLLGETKAEPSPREIRDALQLTAHFLRQRLFAGGNRPLSEERQRLPELLGLA